MNLDIQMMRLAMTTNAAERIYRVAFTIPPQTTVNTDGLAMYTIKLPVPTTLNNAQLMLDIIQITPPLLRTEFYKLIEPKLYQLIREWETLPTRLTLLETYQHPVARAALLNVAIIIHASFPIVGKPEEALAKPSFSLSRPGNPQIQQEQAVYAKRLNQAGARTGWNLYQHMLSFDKEMMQQLAKEDHNDLAISTPPATLFSVDPQICYMPVLLEQKMLSMVTPGKTDELHLKIINPISEVMVDVKTEPEPDISASTAMLTNNSIELSKVADRFQLEMQQIHASCVKLSNLYNMK